MKGRVVLLGAIVLVVALLVWYGYSLSSEDFDIKSSDFSIENTSPVTQYAIYSDTDTIVLSKEQGIWRMSGTDLYVEEKKIAMVNNLLPLVVIEAPVEYRYSAAINKGDIKSFKKVVAKSGDDVIRTYKFYNSGTDIFVDVDSKEAPCYLKITGVSGELSDLFSVERRYWLSNTVFSVSPHSITDISVIYTDKGKESFSLKREEDGQFVLLENGNVTFAVANRDKVYSFLSFASRLSYKSYGKTVEFSDFNNSYLLSRITLKAKKEHVINVYRKISESGEEDLFNAYVIYNNSDVVYEVPYISLDKFLKERSYFK
jgi:hypothetical protein